MVDEENLIGFDALYESYTKCVKGVIWKDSVAHFSQNAVEEVSKLEQQLHDGTYKPRRTKRFRITSPKPRDVISIAFRDRVYQRSLNDNEIYPEMTKHFIYDNWACQKGKGTDAARDRLAEFLHRYFRKHGHVGFVAQFDIHGYYPNMDHDVAENQFKRYLKPNVFNRAQEVMRGQYEGVKGYNPGSQMIQIAGISVLDPLDHYIKEQQHIKYYIRYMDDFILIHHDEAYLRECAEKIIEKLHGMKFEINEKKTKIYNLSKGIMFLGFRFSLTETGKVIRLVDPKRIKAARLKYKRLAAKVAAGEKEKRFVDESYRAFRNNASKGNSYHLLKRMDEFYNNLWRDVQ